MVLGMSLRILTLHKIAKQTLSIKGLVFFPTYDLRNIVHILRVVILLFPWKPNRVIIKAQQHFYRNMYK